MSLAYVEWYGQDVLSAMRVEPCCDGKTDSPVAARPAGSGDGTLEIRRVENDNHNAFISYVYPMGKEPHSDKNTRRANQWPP
jgi:hypothetical protein